MSDVVERLEALVDASEEQGRSPGILATAQDAKAEIRRLRSDLGAAREALGEIENVADSGLDGTTDFETGLPACFRIAHEALARLTKGDAT